jgi:cupin fold WbuC family metalloprotein
MKLFDDQGAFKGVLRFGYHNHGSDLVAGTESLSRTWHTVAALDPGCVLLEVKVGPFDSNQSKVFVPWAPEEGSQAARSCLQHLIFRISV